MVLCLAFAVLGSVRVIVARTDIVESLVGVLLVLVLVLSYCRCSFCWAIASVGGRGLSGVARQCLVDLVQWARRRRTTGKSTK